jgi:vacuolar-type H+-ATPase subunit E/Vma4
MRRNARMTLDSLEDAALDGASAQADEIRRAARRRAEQIIDETRDEAAALRARRHAAAERLADLEERERLAEARAEARATVLHAQRSVLIDATAAAHAAVAQLLEDPRYSRLVERLTADARERLAPVGPAQISIVPDGGVIASAGSCQIDYSLAAQVERCLQAMASDIGGLWQ